MPLEPPDAATALELAQRLRQSPRVPKPRRLVVAAGREDMLALSTRRDAADARAVRAPIARRRCRLRFIVVASKVPSLEHRVVRSGVEAIHIKRIKRGTPALQIVRLPFGHKAQRAVGRRVANVGLARGAGQRDTRGVRAPIEAHARVARIRTRHCRARIADGWSAVGINAYRIETAIASGGGRGQQHWRIILFAAN